MVGDNTYAIAEPEEMNGRLRRIIRSLSDEDMALAAALVDSFREYMVNDREKFEAAVKDARQRSSLKKTAGKKAVP